MFDEPTAGMSVDEVPVILDLIRTIKTRRDKTILLVEHKMDVVRELADRIVVLHNGALVADGEPAEVIACRWCRKPISAWRMAEAAPLLDSLRACTPTSGAYHILHGRRPGRAARRAHRAAGPQRRRQDHHPAHRDGTVARLRRAPCASTAHDITACATPDIARRGIAYVPENMGIFSDLTVRENLLLAARRARRAEHRRKRLDWIFRLFPALKRFWQHRGRLLSGGQKQMLAVARAIVEPRKLLLIDEPSKGLAPAIIQQHDRGVPRAQAAPTPPSCSWSRTSISPSRWATAVAVMDNGRIVHTGAMAALAADEALQQRLLGLSLASHQ